MEVNFCLNSQNNVHSTFINIFDHSNFKKDIRDSISDFFFFYNKNNFWITLHKQSKYFGNIF